jgi:hypothetical protein
MFLAPNFGQTAAGNHITELYIKNRQYRIIPVLPVYYKSDKSRVSCLPILFRLKL